ncbi:ictacalcin [Silurus meridionalis]|nr:ictacalcin [Silurus meridionalis]
MVACLAVCANPKNCKDQAKLNEFFNNLDANKDGKVDFQEYVTLVACITMICNNCCQGKKKYLNGV